MYGGACPLLLSKIIKEPIKGGALDDIGRSNRMVGTNTAASSIPKNSGGELLNSISNLRFGKGVKRKQDQNIKFLF